MMQEVTVPIKVSIQLDVNGQDPARVAKLVQAKILELAKYHRPRWYVRAWRWIRASFAR